MSRVSELISVVPDEPDPAINASPCVPRALSLGELVRPVVGGNEELLKTRFLCRGGGMLLVGPTGIGKSSLSMQCMLSWATNRDVFGIEPNRPLKSLLIQAENDDGDLAEMRDGVVRGMELLRDEAEAAFAQIIVCREDVRNGTAFFAHTVRPLLEAHRPDILWIDPALAYLGGEANSQEAVGGFLRNQLNPLLHEFECAAIIVHHTNKPPKKSDGNGYSSSDSAYLGAGSAEWANWARAVVVLRGTQEPGIFELCASKRGSRLGWRAPDGSTPIYSKYIAHSKGNGEIYWRPATEGEVEATKAGGKTIGTSELGKVLTAIPTIGSIAKNSLVEVCRSRNLGRDRTIKLIKQLVDEGKIHETRVPRTGHRAKPEVHLELGPGPAHGATSCSTPCPPPVEAESQGTLDVPDDTTGPFRPVVTSRDNHPEDEIPSSG